MLRNYIISKQAVMDKRLLWMLFLVSSFTFAQTTVTLEDQCNCEVLQGTDVSVPGVSSPVGADLGDLYVNTTTGTIFFWDGDSWEFTSTDNQQLTGFTFNDVNNELTLDLENGGSITVDLTSLQDTFTDTNTVITNFNIDSGTNSLILTDSDGSSFPISLVSLAAILDTNVFVTDFVLDAGAQELVIINSDGGEFRVSLADIAAATDTNTTNATFEVDIATSELVVADSDGNDVRVPLTDIAALVDTNTEYTAGTGINLTGTEFSVNDTELNPDWANITSIPTDIADGDDNTTNASLTEDGTNLILMDSEGATVTIPLAAIAAATDTDTTNASLTEDGTNLILTDSAGATVTIALASIAAQVDTNTTYTAGAGLDLTGTTFSVDGSSITPDWTNITNIPAGFADDIDNDTQLSDAEVATAVNSEFPNLDTDSTDDFSGDFPDLTNIPAGLADGDDDTTYSAGAGLDLTGTTFSVDGSTITPDWTNITNIPAGFADDIDNDTQMTDAEVATAVNSEFPNLDTDSTDDFDGAWGSLTAVPAGFADNTDDNTEYTAGAGLDLTGTTFSVDGSTITPDWTNITNIPAGFADDIDDDTEYTAGAGLDLTGTTFSVDGSTITPDWTNITNIPAGFADDIDNDTQLSDAQVATAVNSEFPNLDTDST